MSDSPVTLIVLTDNEWHSWKREYEYKSSWPGYNWAYFVYGKQAANKFDINPTTLFVII
jgi:hypothetical protein